VFFIYLFFYCGFNDKNLHADCMGVAFDGSRLWATERARFSFNFRSLIVSPHRYALIRGYYIIIKKNNNFVLRSIETTNHEYQDCLLHFSQLGFGISPPCFIDFIFSFSFLQIYGIQC